MADRVVYVNGCIRLDADTGAGPRNLLSHQGFPTIAARDETIFRSRRNYPETKDFYLGFRQRQAFKVCSMIELVIVVIALFSAGIFVAHAVDAYQAH
ncbi:MAG TPA: hypothetical protein VIH63_14415 [Xanthobacteraceae bacterium]